MPLNAGADGVGGAVCFTNLADVKLDRSNADLLWLTDGPTVRTASISSRKVVTVAGNPSSGGTTDGPALGARFGTAGLGVAPDPAAPLVFVADASNHRVRVLNLSSGFVSTFAGPAGATVTPGNTDGPAAAARFTLPTNVEAPGGGALGITLFISHTPNVRVLWAANGSVTSIGGASAGCADGVGGAALFRLAAGLAWSEATLTLFVSDSNNFIMRAAAWVGGAWRVTTLAGACNNPWLTANGWGPAALFANPVGAALDGAGNVWTVQQRSAVRITPGGWASVVAGAGGSEGTNGDASYATLFFPRAIAVRGSGQNAFIADTRLLRWLACPGGPAPAPSGTPSPAPPSPTAPPAAACGAPACAAALSLFSSESP